MTAIGSDAGSAPPKPVWCFYHIQNERGESAAHPNAFRVHFAGARATAGDVWACFPLASLGAFHFRFQLPAPEGSGRPYEYLDLVHESDVVPLIGGNIHAKLLRLGASARRIRGVRCGGTGAGG